MGTYAVTGATSGMGAASAAALAEAGHTVIGVDLRDAEIIADLGTPEGRAGAAEGILETSDGSLDGGAAVAGVGPRHEGPRRRHVHRPLRSGRPEEIVFWVHQFLRPEARFTTGSVLYVDGGTDAAIRPEDFPTAMTL